MSDQSPSDSENIDDLLRDVQKLAGDQSNASFSSSRRVSPDEEEVVHIEIKIQNNEDAFSSMEGFMKQIHLGRDIILPVVGFVIASAGLGFVSAYSAKSGSLLGGKLFG